MVCEANLNRRNNMVLRCHSVVYEENSEKPQESRLCRPTHLINCFKQFTRKILHHFTFDPTIYSLLLTQGNRHNVISSVNSLIVNPIFISNDRQSNY